VCCWLWTLCHTTQHGAALIIFPLNLQTITACWVEGFQWHLAVGTNIPYVSDNCGKGLQGRSSKVTAKSNILLRRRHTLRRCDVSAYLSDDLVVAAIARGSVPFAPSRGGRWGGAGRPTSRELSCSAQNAIQETSRDIRLFHGSGWPASPVGSSRKFKKFIFFSFAGRFIC